MLSFDDWVSDGGSKTDDALERNLEYNNYLRKELFRDGKYSEEVENQIIQDSYLQAVKDGAVTEDEAGAETFQTAATLPTTSQNPTNIERRARQLGDLKTAFAVSDAATFRKFGDTERAEETLAGVDPDPELYTDSDLARAAVRDGDLAAVWTDGNGNVQIETRPGAGAMSAEEILEDFPVGMDARYLPAVEAKLSIPDGFTVPVAELEREDEFRISLSKLQDPAINAALVEAGSDFEEGDQTYETRLAIATSRAMDHFGARRINGNLSEGEYTEEEVSRYLDNMLRSGERKLSDNPAENVQFLSNGSVAVAPALLAREDDFEEALTAAGATDAQKTFAREIRPAQLDRMAIPVIESLAEADGDILNGWSEAREKGETAGQFLESYLSDDSNYIGFVNRLENVGISILDGVGGLLLYPAAMMGSDTARQAIDTIQKESSANRELARYFGQEFGIGQTIAEQVAPVFADIATGMILSTASAPAGGTAGPAYLASKATLKASLKEGLRNTISGGTKALLRNPAAGPGTLIREMGKDIVRSNAVYLPAFSRSAGGTYIATMNSLDGQVNADGTPKHTEEEKRRIALGAGVTSGVVTTSIMRAFANAGLPGVERLVQRGVTAKQAQQLLAPMLNAAEGKTFESVLRSVAKDATSPILRGGAQVAGEGAEEASDTIANNFVQAVATGDDMDLMGTLREAIDSAIVGGVFGGVGAVADTVPGLPEKPDNMTPMEWNLEMQRNGVDVNGFRAQVLRQTANELEGTGSPKTAAALRRTATQVARNNLEAAEAVRVSVDVAREAGEQELVVEEVAAATEAATETEATTDTGTEPATAADMSPIQQNLVVANAALDELEQNPPTEDTNADEKARYDKKLAFRKQRAADARKRAALEQESPAIVTPEQPTRGGERFQEAAARPDTEIPTSEVILADDGTFVEPGIQSPEPADVGTGTADAEVATAAVTDAVTKAVVEPLPLLTEEEQTVDMSVEDVQEDVEITEAPAIPDPDTGTVDPENVTQAAEPTTVAGFPAPAAAEPDTTEPATELATEPDTTEPEPATSGSLDDITLADVRDVPRITSVMDMRFGGPKQKRLFDSIVEGGFVPSHNILLTTIKGTGEQWLGRPATYTSLFINAARNQIEVKWPLTPLPSNIQMRNSKRSRGKGKVKIPVKSNGEGFFTNDPFTTYLQLDMNLSVKVPKEVTDVNPAISVGKDRFVMSAKNDFGKDISGPGQTVLNTSLPPLALKRSEAKFAAAVANLPGVENVAALTDRLPNGAVAGEGTTEADFLNAAIVAAQTIVQRNFNDHPVLSDGTLQQMIVSNTVASQHMHLKFLNMEQNPELYAQVPKETAQEILPGNKKSLKVFGAEQVENAKGGMTNINLSIRKAAKEVSSAADRRNYTAPGTVYDAEGADVTDVLNRTAEVPTEYSLALDAEFVANLAAGGLLPGGATADKVSEVAQQLVTIVSKPKVRKALVLALQNRVSSALSPSSMIQQRQLIHKMSNQELVEALVLSGSMDSLLKPILGSMPEIVDAVAEPRSQAGIDAVVFNNTALVRQIGLDNGLQAALERIAANRLGGIAKRYVKLSRVLLKHQVNTLPVLVVEDPTSRAAASFNPDSRMIVLNLASDNGRGAVDALLHEVVHAVTYYALRASENSELVGRIETMRQRLLQDPDMASRWAYALSSVDEFVTHAMTSPAFQRVVKEKDAQGLPFLARLWRTISRMLGMEVGLLREIMSFTDTAASTTYGTRVNSLTQEQTPRVFPYQSGYENSMTDGLASQPQDSAAMDALPDVTPMLNAAVQQAFPGLQKMVLDNDPRRVMSTALGRTDLLFVNKDALAQEVAGLDPVNQNGIIRSLVGHEMAHIAGFASVSQEEIDEIAVSMPPNAIMELGTTYYASAGLNPEEAMAQLQEDLADGTMTNSMLVEEFFRMELEKLTAGETSETARAFYATNPNLFQRLLHHLRTALGRMRAYMLGPEDLHMRVAVSRGYRVLRQMERGYVPTPLSRTDPDTLNMNALAMEQGENIPVEPDTESIRVPWWKPGGKFTPPEKMARIFRRITDRGVEAVGKYRRGTLNAIMQAGSTILIDLEKAAKAENVSQEFLQRMVGAGDANLTMEQAEEINAAHARAMEESAVMSGMDSVRAAEQAHEQLIRSQRAQLNENAQVAKKARDDAWNEAADSAPKTLEAVKEFRDLIDEHSRYMRDQYGEDEYLHMVIDANLGLYVTRSYQIHHDEGDPLQLYADAEKDEAKRTSVQAAENFLWDYYIESEAKKMEARGEADTLLQAKEILENERKQYREDGLGRDRGRDMVEKYLRQHGSSIDHFHGGSDTRASLANLHHRSEMPAELRELMGERTDPVSQLAGTLMAVSTMAVNTKFNNELSAMGQDQGFLLTAAQHDGYVNLMQITDPQEFAEKALELGFAQTQESLAFSEALRVESPYAETDPATDAETIMVGVLDVDGETTPAPVYIPNWLADARRGNRAQALGKLDNWKQIDPNTKSYSNGDLGGLYAEPTVAEWLSNTARDMATTEADRITSAAYRVFAKATGASLATVTLGGVGFYTRNAVGNAFLLLSQGINPWSSEAVRQTLTAVDTHFNRKSDDDIRKMMTLNITGDTLRPQVIRSLIKGMADDPRASMDAVLDRAMKEAPATKVTEKIWRGITIPGKAVVNKLTAFSGAIEDAAKIRAFAYELGVMLEAEPEMAKTAEGAWELEKIAADKVLKTFQSTVETPPVIKSLSATPFGVLFVPFLRFKAEMVRIPYNTVELGIQEMKSDNPVIRSRGRRRLMGFTAIMAVSGALPLALKEAAGIGEEEDDMLRASVPEFLRDNSLWYFIDREKGKIVSIDFTYTNPYSFTTDPIARAIEHVAYGRPSKALSHLPAWAIKSITEEQILMASLSEVLNNEDSSGNPIVNKAIDSEPEQLLKRVTHLFSSSYSPALFRAANKATERARFGVSKDAAFFDTAAGALVAHGLPTRPYVLDTKDALRRAARDLETTKKEGGLLMAPLFNPNTILPEAEIYDNVEAVTDFHRAIAETAASHARAAQNLGLSKRETQRQLQSGGFGQTYSRNIVWRELAEPKQLTQTAEKNIANAGEKAAGTIAAGRERVRLVNKALRELQPRIIRVPAED